MKKKASIGQIIRRIRSNEISSTYALYGGDSFLEDFFISELVNNYLDKSNKKKYFSLDQDTAEDLSLEQPVFFTKTRFVLIVIFDHFLFFFDQKNSQVFD